MMEDWLLGIWRLMRADPSLDFAPGVRMEFLPQGQLRYHVDVGGRDQVIALRYRRDGDLLHTDNPAAPHSVTVRIVHGEGDYGPIAPALPKPMPDWSPVATFGGHYRRPEATQKLASACGCASACNVHGHDHAAALGANVPAADVQSFWGAFGCGCWAV